MEECPVCLESLKNGQIVTVDCCKKQFHVNCYVSAMNVNPTCPLCRKEQVVIEMPPQPQSQPPQIIIIDQRLNIVRRCIQILIICGMVRYIFYISQQ
jgi:hypothetical protein